MTLWKVIIWKEVFAKLMMTGDKEIATLFFCFFFVSNQDYFRRGCVNLRDLRVHVGQPGQSHTQHGVQANRTSEVMTMFLRQLLDFNRYRVQTSM